MKLSYEHLAAAPELGPLAVLRSAIDIAVLALAAAWPDLHTDELRYPQSRAALDVIERARDLALALRRYRRALRDSPDTDCVFPF